MSWLLGLAGLAAALPAGLRWLRVAQREHYLPSAVRFAGRWWGSSAPAAGMLALGLAALAAALWVPAAGLVAAAVAAAGPPGLGVRGRTSPLAWTPRLRRLAGAAVGVTVPAAVALAAAGRGGPAAGIGLLVPLVVDGGLAVLAPLERRLGAAWVERAATALRSVDPKVVAITGSYGKTTTKGYVAHLLSSRLRVVPSPASFNNRMGLARAINERLAPGTEVFVAEMGIYGPGEIAELCGWIPPDVAVITAIGPVHLERMGSEERILAAKREILERAPVAVLSVDHPLLEAVAREEEGRRRVIRCSGAGRPAEVTADPESGEVAVAGRVVGRFDPASARAGNVACAVGVAIGLGLDPAVLGGRLADLPITPHRLSAGTSERGFTVLDDTFNANPAGAAAALAALAAAGVSTGRRVVVTPGMVELGARQPAENARLAREAGTVADGLVVVGRTNRRALLEGAAEGGIGSVIVTPTREAAVAWVRSQLGPGDAVLYENDLPDHYP
jgi:UDP-N-acetylmuramoyl-tripeptide--D-alanyl-D-alanine ligase